MQIKPKNLLLQGQCRVRVMQGQGQPLTIDILTFPREILGPFRARIQFRLFEPPNPNRTPSDRIAVSTAGKLPSPCPCAATHQYPADSSRRICPASVRPRHAPRNRNTACQNYLASSQTCPPLRQAPSPDLTPAPKSAILFINETVDGERTPEDRQRMTEVLTSDC